jgi:hypothetical protein
MAVIVAYGLGATSVHATSDTVVIARVQTGGSGTGTTTQEFVNLYNNSATDVDVSNWCLKYTDYNDANPSLLTCFSVSPGMDQVHMPAQSASLIISPSYVPPAGVASTAIYATTSTNISSTRGHVTLFDSTGAIIDRLAWDNGASTPPKYPETHAAVAPSGGSMLTRFAENGQYIDTDNNSVDFVVAPSAPLSAAALIDYKEPVPVVDLCPTLAGIQEALPVGYDYDEAGNCELLSLDVCQNIEHIQLAVPDAMARMDDGNCYDLALDACKNIEGFQLMIPEGHRSVSGSCKLMVPMRDVRISELLANSSGVDTGHEFIELYNNDSVVVDLADYTLHVGKTAEKQITLPEVLLQPGQYISFSDSELGYTLLNTTSRLELRYYDGELVDEIIPYQNPADDIAWALVDDTWQLTNRPTPGAANESSAEVLGSDSDQSAAALTTCSAGKYRNPLTNRCRSIEADATVLAACDVDEYRNPETNRCRNIALVSTSLTPCQDGYERNPDTNRCRKITSEPELVPCQEGYERNPDTNRCRKLVESAAQQAVVEVEQSAQNMGTYAVAAVAATCIVGYGVYEWRSELAKFGRRFARLIVRK